MLLKPQKPIREWRFQITLRYNNGEEEQVQLTGTDADKIEKLIAKLPLQGLEPAAPVSAIVLEVGDETERWIQPGQEPAPFADTIINEPEA